VHAGASFLSSGTTTIFRLHVDKPSKDWAELTDEQIRSVLKAAEDLISFHNIHAQAFELSQGETKS